MLQKDFEELMRRRPDLRPLFERVKASSRYQAFWRLKAKYKLDRTVRSSALLKAQFALGKIAYANFGKKGFDENGVPIVASNIGKETKGKKYKEKKIPEWQKMVERIRRREEAIVV
jgi:hypothetical protein